MHMGKNPLELKSPAEVAKIRRAGALLARVLREVGEAVAVGVTTEELDRLARARIEEGKGKPAFLGMYGFPKTLCISINEEIVHGIPGKRRLERGDIVSVDCGVRMDGFYADHAMTFAVGECAPQAQRLLDVTREALKRAIAACRPGNRWGDVGWAVQSIVEENGFSVVEGYTGHGIGRHLHEEPQVENRGKAGTGRRIVPGTVVALEPMVNAGTGETETLEDDWTVVTADRSLSAHFEHTVAVTEKGVEILTLPG